MASTLEEGILMSNLIPPVFIVDGEDVGVFASLEEALLQLEPRDVTNQEYTGYDSEGRLLRLETDGERVSAYLAEDEPIHALQLETALRCFLRAMNEPSANDPKCDLSCLVAASRRFTHRSRSPVGLLLEAWRKLIRKSEE